LEKNKYQYSNQALRLSGQTTVNDEVFFFVSKSLQGIEGQIKESLILQFCPESLGAMLEY